MYEPVQGCKSRIMVDGIELSDQSTSVGLNGEITMYDFQRLTDCVGQSVPVGSGFTIDHTGFYTGVGAHAIEKVFADRIKTGQPCIVAVTFDGITYLLEDSWASQMTINAPVKEVITIEGTWAKPKSIRRARAGMDTSAVVTAVGQAGDDLAYVADMKAGEVIVAVGVATGQADDIIIAVKAGADEAGLASVGTVTATKPGMYKVAVANHQALYRVEVTDMGGATSVPVAFFVV